MNRLVPAFVLLLSSLFLAAPLRAQPLEEMPPERRKEMMERMRTMRAVALANRLDLDEKAALRLNGIMKHYDDERSKVHERLRRHLATLREAARAEAPDAQRVDAAIAAILEGMEDLDRLRREEAQALLRDLDPKRRAKLLLFLHEFPKELRRHLRRAREQKQGRRQRRRPAGPPRPAQPPE
ncbi:MAG: hypothetical protein D6729_15030 [Deltaproteobacteria bacterium]|nr:MAG: hypothetical protein D6729_15030 [Deltaproteobacteria bacterium]